MRAFLDISQISCNPVTPRVILDILTRAHTFKSRISPRFSSKILNLELQVKEIQDPEKLIRDPYQSLFKYSGRLFDSTVAKLNLDNYEV